MMNSLKTLISILSLGLLFTFSSPTLAQNTTGKMLPQSEDEVLSEIRERLHLSATQQVKLKDIIKAMNVEGKNIQETTKPGEPRRMKMMTLMAKTNERILIILDNNQKKLFMQMQTEKAEEMRKQMDQHKDLKQQMKKDGLY